jgi:hypothetical protein
MRLIHHSRFRNPDGTPAPKKGRARRALGADWLTSHHSEDTAIQILADNLDDDYTLLCNITLPDLTHDADMILIGPKGIWVFEFIYFEGLFKADKHNFHIYVAREQRFKRCQPNAALQAAEDVAAFRKIIEPHFQEKGARLPWVIPVVLAINPKTHIQRTESVAITILRYGELYEYALQRIKKFEDVLTVEDSETIVATLQRAAKSVKRAPEQKKIFHYRQKRIRGYSMAQWSILLAIGAVNLCCFGSLALTYIYINSPIMRATLDGWLVRLRILLFR